MATITDAATPAASASAQAARSTRRRRYKPVRFAPTPSRTPRRSWLLTGAMTLVLLYSLFPLFWLVVNSTKSVDDLFTTFGLWFSDTNSFVDNVVGVFTYDDGVFLTWFRNTVMYTLIGAGGSTLIAALAGYGLAKFSFPGRRAVFAVVLAAIAVPGSALAVPTFLLFSQLGLTNTPWAIIIPSLVTPFGLYLLWVYAADSIPNELLEAARVDGSGEFRTFFTIGLRLMAPGLLAVFLLEIVGSWNNYFLPLIMLNDPQWYPLTVGLNQWNAQASTADGDVIFNLVITGSLLAIIPIIIVFLALQRFWQSGLAAGSVKG
ncbi:carbohydrate ABC transporter permease [Microbacterium sp. EST19A]|uniref:carbohydrate ABC transporter permease n=1 Tax=Microbacterium sp. EST19A TaxID=2862681 RepID=UPI001CBD3730|nr:carbohydrate ABC transporter permease [Microbacterium sp. EST19A]